MSPGKRNRLNTLTNSSGGDGGGDDADFMGDGTIRVRQFVLRLALVDKLIQRLSDIDGTKPARRRGAHVCVCACVPVVLRASCACVNVLRR